MTQEIEIIIDEPIVLTIGAQQVLPDSIVLDENYVHTDNNYTDADKNKVANALTSETDPTVPSWAKQPSKPSYNKSEIGLGDVDNTSDANKPISTATQTVLNTKADKTYVDNELSQKADSSSLPAAIKANETLTAINGLSLTGNILTISYTGENGVTQTKNVDLSSLTTTDVKVSNTAYNAATNIITITNSDASTFNIDLSEFSIIASTDGNGVTTLVQEGVTKATISRVGQTGDYNDLTNKPTLGTASAQNSTAFATAAQGVKADTALQSETDPTVPAWAKQPLKPSYNKSEIGLGNVDNTSDANKPVSTATQTALNNKLNSSALSISTGQVAFGSGSNTIGGDNGLFWDNTNKRLGIGTTAPTGKLDIQGLAINDLPTYSAEFLLDTGWTSTDWTGNFATGWTHTTGNTTVLSQSKVAVNATKYQIAYTVTGRTAGSFTIGFGGQTSSAITATGAWGPTTSSTNNLTITPTTDFNGTIVISIKSITAISTPLVNLKSSDGTARIEMRANTTTGNTFIGLGSGRYNTTGSYNTANGFQALYSNTTGNYNTANGVQSLFSNTTGSSNTPTTPNTIIPHTNYNNTPNPTTRPRTTDEPT
jgi:hypothetical protein